MFKQIVMKKSALETFKDFYEKVFLKDQDIFVFGAVGESYVLSSKTMGTLHIQKMDNGDYTAHTGSNEMKEILLVFLGIICSSDEYEVKTIGGAAAPTT